MYNINITGPINETAYTSFLASFHEITDLGITKDVLVIINSNGGDVVHGLAIHDLLKSLPNKVTTITIGSCHSMATIIFLAGKYRYAYKNCEFLFHRSAYMYNKPMNQSKLEKELAFIKKTNKKLEDIIFEYCKNEEFLKTLKTDEDIILSAEECLSLGFVTKIYSGID